MDLRRILPELVLQSLPELFVGAGGHQQFIDDGVGRTAGDVTQDPQGRLQGRPVGGYLGDPLVNDSSWRRSTSDAVAAMKSPMVSKCRNSAPTDTPARLVITAADARA